ncbi:MAG TPA: glycosyltransferase family 4 protein [Planctomycetota bacterium]|nr:glycosyltransferase family 4 protein [Planctomycetota bacterium]
MASPPVPPPALSERAKLHVLFVVHGFPPQTWAGTEVYTLSLAQELEKLGHRCTVLARAGAERSEEQGGPADFSLALDEFQGLRVWRMTHRLDHKSLRESYDQPRAEAAFRELCERERPDLVHFQHLLHFSAGLPRVARELAIPSVITCNDYWALCARVQLVRPNGVRCEENQGMGCLWCVEEKHLRAIPLAKRILPATHPMVLAARFLAVHPKVPSKKLERFFERELAARRVLLGRWGQRYEDVRDRQEVVLAGYAAADLLIAPSRFLRRKLLDTGRFDPQRVIHCAYGTRTDRARALAKRPDPEGRLRIGYVGSLVWYKGVDVLVRAMARLAGRKAELHVHGDFRPREDAYHAELERLARGSAIHFHGRFDNSRLAEIHSCVDVLAVPSVWFENSPIAIHEAFLFGTPVVASGIGGMAELVRDGVDGLHFRAGDPEDLARALERFLAEPDLAARLARNLPRVKPMDEHARELEGLYRGLGAPSAEARGPGRR